jgi:hypothetical protein
MGDDAMSEWQPIETASKNDGDVLLFRIDEWGDADMVVGWRGHLGLWRYNNGAAGDEEITPRPTHWMPLPEPPE